MEILFEKCIYQKIQQAHNGLVGHSGVQKTIDRLQKLKLTWSGMRKDVSTFIHNCPCCQKMNKIKTLIQTIPVNFAEFHRFMTMSSAEVDAEYEEDIQRHVSDGMLKNTRIRELLRGKGKGAFVHNGKWEGLKGLEPLWPEGQRGLELSWKEELVDQLRSKIKARPINLKLYAACKEESEFLVS